MGHVMDLPREPRIPPDWYVVILRHDTIPIWKVLILDSQYMSISLLFFEIHADRRNRWPATFGSRQETPRWSSDSLGSREMTFYLDWSSESPNHTAWVSQQKRDCNDDDTGFQKFKPSVWKIIHNTPPKRQRLLHTKMVLLCGESVLGPNQSIVSQWLQGIAGIIERM